MLNLLEIEVFKVEVNFDDAGCFDASAQNVLLARRVILSTKPIKIVQKATPHGKKCLAKTRRTKCLNDLLSSSSTSSSFV